MKVKNFIEALKLLPQSADIVIPAMEVITRAGDWLQSENPTSCTPSQLRRDISEWMKSEAE